MIQTVDIGKLITNTIVLTISGALIVKGYGKLMYLKGYEEGKKDKE